MKPIRKLLKDERFRELFIYALAGIVTTIINYLVYVLTTRLGSAVFRIPVTNAFLLLAGNVLGWIFSVAFAFWSNKVYVFKSASWEKPTVLRELIPFVAARLFSLVLDNAFMELAVCLMGMNDLIAKLLSNLLVILMNYFLSKFLIFRKKKTEEHTGRQN